jgi:SulP family sulfate permease
VIEGLARKAHKRGVRLYLAGASPEIRQALAAHGVHPPEVTLTVSVDAALRMERDAAAG